MNARPLVAYLGALLLLTTACQQREVITYTPPETAPPLTPGPDVSDVADLPTPVIDALIPSDTDAGQADVTDANADQEAGPSDLGPTLDDLSAETQSDTLSADASAEIAEELDTGLNADPDRCAQPGQALSIYDLQNPECPEHPEVPQSPLGIDVTLEGVIVTAVFNDTFFVQEATGGPYSGLAVYAHGKPTGWLSPGMIVEVSGSFGEFYDCSQLYLDTVNEQGSTEVPAPLTVADPNWIMTDGPLAEALEGVLVRVENLETTHTQPDCPHDWGEFEVAGGLRIDDMGVDWTARLGDEFSSITGPLHYSFGNTKIEPRTEEDIAWTVKGQTDAVSKCIASECSIESTDQGTRELIINEIMVDPYGSDGGKEWFELYNPGDQPIDIQGWFFRDCGDQEVSFVGSGMVVPARGYFVAGISLNASLNGNVPVNAAYGDAFYLPNTVGSLLLYNADEQLVDQARYTAFEEWSDIFELGSSLERLAPNNDGTQAASWSAATESWSAGPDRGTPGAKNSNQ